MNKHNLTPIAILFTILSLSNAQAGFDMTRMTTVVDDHNGSYTVTKSGRLEDHEFTGTSIAEFSNFHFIPENEKVNIAGTLSKIITKVKGNRTTSSDGQLVLTTSEKTINISFTDLSVQINKNGATIAGEVTANDKIFNASELPSKLAKLLKKIFFLSKK